MQNLVRNAAASRIKAIFALAALVAAVGAGQSAACAQDGNELSRSGDYLSRLPMRPIAAPAQETAPSAARLNAEARALELSASRPKDAGALVDGATHSAPIVAASTLVGSDQRWMPASPSGERTGGGFAPIRAAMTSRNETSNALSRSAEAASQLYGAAPVK